MKNLFCFIWFYGIYKLVILYIGFNNFYFLFFFGNLFYVFEIRIEIVIGCFFVNIIEK